MAVVGSKIADAYIQVGADTTQAYGALGALRTRMGGLAGSVALFAAKAFALVAVLRTLGHALQSSFRATVGFSQAMAEATAVSDTTADQFEAMSNMAIKMSTDLGVAAEDLAKAFYYLGSAGLSATEQIAAFPHVATLAKAGMMDMGYAAESVVDTMKGFQIAFTNTSYVTDVMAKAVTSSNMTFTQLGESLSYTAGIAKVTNNTFEETVTMIAAMADVGIKGSRAGMAMRTGLTRLAAPTSEARDKLESLGIAIYDDEGRMRSLMEIMRVLVPVLRRVNEETRNSTLEALFGKRVLAGMLELIRRGPGDLQKFADSLENSFGASFEVAQKQLRGTHGSIDIFTEACRNAGRSFIEFILKPNIEYLEIMQELKYLEELPGKELESATAKLRLDRARREETERAIEKAKKLSEIERENERVKRDARQAEINMMRFKLARLAVEYNTIVMDRARAKYAEDIAAWEKKTADILDRQRRSKLGVLMDAGQFWATVQRSVSRMEEPILPPKPKEPDWEKLPLLGPSGETSDALRGIKRRLDAVVDELKDLNVKLPFPVISEG